MKKINELSDKQVLALTNADLEKMVKVAMAENGIKILSAPVEPVYRELPKKTEKAYSVSGFSPLLRDKQSAEDLGATIRAYGKELVKSNYIASSFDIKTLKELDKYDSYGDVKEEYFFSKEDLELLDQITKDNTASKDRYNELLDEYLEENEKASKVSSVIYQLYNSIMDKYYNMNQMKARYEEYLALADKDAKIAMTFLKKAYSIDPETEQYVKDGKVNDTIELVAHETETTTP